MALLLSIFLNSFSFLFFLLFVSVYLSLSFFSLCLIIPFLFSFFPLDFFIEIFFFFFLKSYTSGNDPFESIWILGKLGHREANDEWRMLNIFIKTGAHPHDPRELKEWCKPLVTPMCSLQFILQQKQFLDEISQTRRDSLWLTHDGVTKWGNCRGNRSFFMSERIAWWHGHVHDCQC